MSLHSFSQNHKSELKRLQASYDSLEIVLQSINDSTVQQIQKIRLLTEEIEKSRKASAEAIDAWQKENEELRKIMVYYIRQIEEMNARNLELEQKSENSEPKN